MLTRKYSTLIYDLHIMQGVFQDLGIDRANVDCPNLRGIIVIFLRGPMPIVQINVLPFLVQE